MKKLILIYGAIAGLIITSMFVISFIGSSSNFESGELIGYSSMIIAFASIFVAVKSYRDKTLGGSISFGKAFKIGLGISLVATVIYTVSWLIMSETIAKDFMTDYYQYHMEQMKSSGLSEDQLNEKIVEMDYFMELYKNPLVKIGMTMLEIFPVGLIVSLISALILKRKS